MNIYYRTAVNIFLIVVCLAPTVFILSIGFLWGLLAIYGSLKEFTLFIGVILFPAYAIYCLLWLAFKQCRLSINKITYAIWIGLCIGHIVLLIIVVLMSGEMNSLTSAISLSWIAGLGPAVYSWILLIDIYLRQKSSPANGKACIKNL
ncbi:hypothetical protein [Pleionea sediminis]|uniref:hypothetical protein n=1 Tax=Pleionea sediminis TaxID=2569479 RepID=UPI001185C853|nr:hypothetical protein [Pleionea sediminis]